MRRDPKKYKVELKEQVLFDTKKEGQKRDKKKKNPPLL